MILAHLDPAAALVASAAAPLAAAFVALAAPRAGAAIAILAGGLNLGLVLAAFGAIGAGAQLGGWAAPLGIAFRLDALAWVFLAFGAVVFAAAGIAGRETLARPAAAPLWLTLLAGVNTAFLSADLFNLFVALEVVGLSAAALTAVGGGAAAARAGLRYLLVGMGAGLLFLMGVSLLYRATGALDLAAVAARIGPGPALAAALGLMTAGLLLKGGVAPLHFWLPPAHGGAAPAVSAVLSGVVVKTALYLLLRIWSGLAPAGALSAFAPLFLGLGVFAILVGGFGALRAGRLKTLIAYSTVAQLGYLSMALGLLDAAPGALLAFAVFAAAHALAKAGLFSAAGLWGKAAGHDEIARLGDPGRRFGPAKAAMFVSAVALAGLPPTGGFLAKWTLAQGAAAAGAWWVAPVLVGGGLLTAAATARLAAPLLRASANDGPGPSRGWSALALSAGAVGLGFAGAPLTAILLEPAQ